MNCPNPFQSFRALVLAFWLWPIVLHPQSNPDGTAGPCIERKGLQVQMVDDALALGIRHAALNVDLCRLPDLEGHASNPRWTNSAGRVFFFQKPYLDSLDHQIVPLTETGVQIHLILLAYEPVANARALRALMLHPRYDYHCPNHLSAFNTITADGRDWFVATLEFLAHHWGGGKTRNGRVSGWILGNEVNSHGFWCNMGNATMDEFAADFEPTLRLAHRAIKKWSPDARLYVSLEHHWTIRYPGGNLGQAFPARPFLEQLNRLSKQGGDYDWHVAFHPYPENLFEPRTWNDQSALPTPETPRITFKNLEVLPTFLKQTHLRVDGKVRRIILSEQGFHTPDGADGESIQAAAYCYAWQKVCGIPEIDAFILHRHVDHGAEGGLRLGLWNRDLAASNPASPLRKKQIWKVFQAAGTTNEEASFRFASRWWGSTNRERPALPHSNP